MPLAKLAAGNLANIGIGTLNPSFQRIIINNSGLAHWFPMDPEANWTILGTRRSMITWVFLLYLAGFHLGHYSFERIQRGMDTFTVAQKRDSESAFSTTGRMDGWNMWYAIVGKHLQVKFRSKWTGRRSKTQNTSRMMTVR